MIRLFIILLLWQGAIGFDLADFLQKSAETIINEDVSALLEAIQNLSTPDEDLADFKAILVKNAQSNDERKVIESMSDLLKGIISARQAMGLDSQLYASEYFAELSSLFNPNARKASPDSEWKLDADLFDAQVQEFIAALPNSESVKDGRKYRLVKVSAEEKEEEAHRLSLNFYKTLYPNGETPSFVTDELIEIVLNAAKSEEFTDSEAEKAADEFREAVALLEKGLRKVYISDSEDLEEKQQFSTVSENNKHEMELEAETSTQKEETTKAEIQREELIEIRNGRKYHLIEMNEKETEENAVRITLNYYHSLFPDVDRPTFVTDELNEKLFNAVRSIDLSNHRKTEAQNEFQEELELHQKGLR